MDFIGGYKDSITRITRGEHSPAVLFPRLSPSNFHALAPAVPIGMRFTRPIAGNAVMSSYAFAHHRLVEGRKVVYCHSPLRQTWSGGREYSASYSVLKRGALMALGPSMRLADRKAAASADLYVATSRAVQQRISLYYGHVEIPIIPPPIDDSVFWPDTRVEREDAYLWVGRIVEPYKRLSLVLEAFKRSPRRRLTVVGEGPDRAKLEAHAPPNVEFVGRKDGLQLAAYFAGAAAVIFPSTDDFGLVPIEAAACGTPIIAFAEGGALDTVVEGVNGIFFDTLSPISLLSAVAKFERADWSSEAIVGSVTCFSRERFSQDLASVLNAIGS